jgi:hypothetical protein
MVFSSNASWALHHVIIAFKRKDFFHGHGVGII